MTNEFMIKLDRLRGLMKDERVDAIYIKRQDNFAWLTCGRRNYVGMGDIGNCGLLILSDSLYAVTNNIEAPRMKTECKLEELGFDIRFGLWHDTSFEKRTIDELVPSGKVLFDTADGGKIKLLRFDLTDAEIARYQEIGYDASLAMESAAMGISVGMTEFEIAGLIMKNMEEKGLELLSCMVAADERMSLYRHPLPTDKKVVKKVQIGGNFRRDGLVVCMTRYVYFEEPSDTIRKQYHDTQVIDCTYMASCLPGISFSDVLRLGQSKYKELGYAEEFPKHHQGGPIGYAGRDYRVDFTTPGVISGHQAFCWNPSITGTKSEDTVICTDNGVIPVSRPVLFPKVEIEVCGQVFIRPDILVKTN